MTWALITGSSRRLGADLAKALAAMGRNILVHGQKNREAAESTAQACRDLGVQAEVLLADLARPEEVEILVSQIQQRFPDLSLLINNVGPYALKPLLDTSVAEWRGLFEIHVHTPLALSLGLLPQLQARHGQIINIGMAGIQNLGADPKRSAYKVAKTTLWMQTKALAKELAPHGVRVNMVSPGYLENSEELPDPLPRYSIGRPASTQEVVDAVRFFLDPRHEYVTGQNLEVAGGVAL